jgi:hypothetical protein
MQRVTLYLQFQFESRLYLCSAKQLAQTVVARCVVLCCVIRVATQQLPTYSFSTAGTDIKSSLKERDREGD